VKNTFAGSHTHHRWRCSKYHNGVLDSPGFAFWIPQARATFSWWYSRGIQQVPTGYHKNVFLQKKPTKGLALHHVKVLRAELYRNWTCTLSSSASQALIIANPTPLSFNPTTTHNLLLVLESQNLDLTNVVRVYLVELWYESCILKNLPVKYEGIIVCSS
jgi:hypothetical protein